MLMLSFSKGESRTYLFKSCVLNTIKNIKSAYDIGALS